MTGTIKEISSLSPGELRALQEAEAARQRAVPQVELPDDKELAALLDLVAARWPQLSPTLDQADVHASGACLSLLLLHHWRPRALNRSIAIHMFVDEARERLQGRGEREWRNVGARSFYTAAILAGVVYAAPSRFPHDLALGLQRFDFVAQPFRLAWRDVLASRQVPPPVAAMATPRPPQPVLQLLPGAVRTDPWNNFEGR